MRTVPEGELVAGVVAPDVEQVGIGELALVMVGGRTDDQQLGAGRNRHAGNGGIAGGQPAPGRDRPVVAQAFFDRVGNQRRVFA
ncbi:hypothetical protein G6F22_021120 [Rhizopus arrhizus]|nr:hypothetical protein G6F22_021120 [Rhizopus arrhizus]KAG1062488.1 hypothetical protein G6F40_017947 [Rhizopus arrhizus]